MRLADRYVLREFIQAFLIGLLTAVLLVVALRFQQTTTQLARNQASPSFLLQQILWDLPNVLEMALPVATALGAALATNRLVRDNELTVLRGTGKPLVRLFAPFVGFGVVLALAGLYTADVLQPLAVRKSQEAGGLRPGQNTFEAGQTVRGGEKGEWLIQFQEGQKVGEGQWILKQVTLIQKTHVVVAKEGRYESATGRWTLVDVVEHRYGGSGTLQLQRRLPAWTTLARTDFSSGQTFWGLQQSFQTPLRFRELTKAAAAARYQGDRKKALELETARWFKLALSSMSLVFALCSPPLCVRFSRSGSFAGVLLAIVIVFVGWNTVLLMKSVSLSGWVPPVVCAFATHTLFLLAGLWLLARSD